ncbi:MAG: hypothetical protein V1887_02505 [Candidatus Aenigmatarchaeota archaeon]
MQKSVALVMLVLVIAASGCIGQSESDPYRLTYAGQSMKFRANLQEAQNVPVNDANAAREMLFDVDVKKVYLAFVPSDRTFRSVSGNATYTALYGTVGFELAYKIGAVWGVNFGEYAPLETVVLNSSAEAASLATRETPLILMVAGAPETSVVVSDNMITVNGENMEEIDRAYTDLDLAADKLILVLMGRD